MPDIFSAYADYAYELYGEGQLADLSTYLSEQERSKYIEAYLSEGGFAGENSVLLFPVAKSTEVLLVNMTDFVPFAAACDVSEQDLATWEGITAVAEKYYHYTDLLTETPHDGKAFFGRDSMANYILVGCAQLGQPLIESKDGKVSVDVDRGTLRRLWDYYYVPYISGHFAALGRFRSDDAKTGDIIALVGSTSGCSYFPSAVTRADGSSYPITAKVFPLPNFAGCERYAVQQGAGMAVAKSDQRTEQAAVTFLKWFAEPEQNIRFSACTGYLPVQKAANDSKLLHAAVLEEKLELLPIVEDTLKIGMDMSGSYRFFTNPAFKNSYACRSLVGIAMQAQSDQDLAAVNARIESGTSPRAALEPFLEDAHFELWLSDFERALRETGTAE
ncbi:Bacterial extracellular solute-binding protein [anaerobic digester metagenome]